MIVNSNGRLIIAIRSHLNEFVVNLGDFNFSAVSGRNLELVC